MTIQTMPLGGPMDVLERAAVGAPISRSGISLFPLYVIQPFTPAIATGIADAIRIDENDQQMVSTIKVTSLIDKPFLLVEGETFKGGLQQRTLNVSVLVPPRVELDIPVSCVEAGRWSGDRSFDGVSGQVSRRVRRAKAEGVAQNVRLADHKASDQHAVWESVDGELCRLAAPSPTRNYADAEMLFDQRDDLADSVGELTELGPLPGMCGVVVGHGRRIVSAEVFADAELFAAKWDQIVRSIILDAPDDVVGRPSPTAALRFVQRLARAKPLTSSGVGLGFEGHIQSPNLVGQTLVWDELLVHAVGFAT
ncbi:MAG: DUF6569 family protein [Microthrixaceae bacterium]